MTREEYNRKKESLIKCHRAAVQAYMKVISKDGIGTESYKKYAKECFKKDNPGVKPTFKNVYLWASRTIYRLNYKGNWQWKELIAARKELDIK